MAGKKKKNANRAQSKGGVGNRQTNSRVQAGNSLAPNFGMQQKKKRKPKQQSVPRNLGRLVENICALSDPFCPAAKGSRWPDGTTEPTLGYQWQVAYTIDTGAAGYGFSCIYPGAQYGYTSGTGAANAVVVSATWTTFGAALGTFMGNASTYRLVSCGVEITPNTSMSSSNGTIYVSDYATGAVLGTTVTMPNLMLGSEMKTLSMKSSDSLIWHSRPLGAAARNFTAADANNDETLPWTRCAIQVAAGPASATAVVTVRVVLNYELMIAPGNALTQAMPASTPPNAPLQDAAGSIASTLDATMRATADSFGPIIKDAAIEYVRSYLGGPRRPLLMD